jgi:transmembrane sensor
MSANDERLRSLIIQQAADWFIANRAGLAGRERQAFAAWLKASPVHVEEYLALSVIARDLHAACEAPQSSIDDLLARARHEEDSTIRPLWARLVEGLRTPSPRWQTAAVAMAAIGVVSLGLLVLWTLKPIANVAALDTVTALHFETRHGEQQTHRLADYSMLHLNTNTAVTIRYSRKERLVTLTSGEADFEVARAGDRPFRVFAGAAEVVDLGTKFDVRLQDNSTLVTVIEGRVAVGPSPLLDKSGTNARGHLAPPQFVQLGADQQIRVTEGEWPATPVPIDAQRATAWLHRQIMFKRQPLERVASEFNRYAPKPFVITSPALRSLEISGVFATDDSEAFIAFLRSLQGVHVEVTATSIRVSQD